MRICLKIVIVLSLFCTACYHKNNAIKKIQNELEHKNFLECIEECNRAISVDPTFAPLYFYKATAYQRLKNYTEAIVNCYIVLNLDSSFSNAYNLRGTLKYEQALEGCRYPDCKDLGKYYYIQIVAKEVIAEYTNAIRIDPKNMNAYCNRAIAKNKIEDYSGALIDCKKVLELDSLHSHIYEIMGYAKYKLGDKEGASKDGKKYWQLWDKYNGIRTKDATQ